MNVDDVYEALFLHTVVQSINASDIDLGKPSDENTAALTLRSFNVRLLSNVSRLVIVKEPAVAAVVSVSPTPVTKVRLEPTSACTVTMKVLDE